MKSDVNAVYTTVRGEAELRMLWLDTLCLPHLTGRRVKVADKRMYAVETWKQKDGQRRIVGVRHHTFPSTKGWMLGEKEVELDSLTIRVMTKSKALRKFKPPPSQEQWELRIPVSISWNKVWKVSPTFATPRDQQTFLKLQHRNLFVANRDQNSSDPNCLACRSTPESMFHLAECVDIYEGFWKSLIDFLVMTGMRRPEHIAAFLVLGRISHNEYIDPHRASVLHIAWRCLYASIVSSRLDSEPFDLSKAQKRSFAILHSRVDAYGEKWKLWVRRNWRTSNKHIIPEKHRNKVFITFDPHGNYTIEPLILRFHSN